MHTIQISSLDKSILAEFLTQANLKLLLARSNSVQLKPGEFLFREGQKNCNVFILLDGQLDLTMTVPGRGPTTILTLGPGDLVAWSAVLGDGVMTSSARCVQAAHLIAIDCQHLLDCIESDSRFGYEFMKMMATALGKRLVATRLQLLDLFSSN